MKASLEASPIKRLLGPSMDGEAAMIMYTSVMLQGLLAYF